MARNRLLAFAVANGGICSDTARSVVQRHAGHRATVVRSGVDGSHYGIAAATEKGTGPLSGITALKEMYHP